MSTDVFTLPRDFSTGKGVPPIVFYSAAIPSVKNRVILTQNLCCFLLRGTKKVHATDSFTQAYGGELLLLPAGNVLMTETLTEKNQYDAILVFLSDEEIAPADAQIKDVPSVAKIPFDEFIETYIRSLQLLQNCDNSDIITLKVKELATYLRLYYPEQCAIFNRQSTNSPVSKFKAIISENAFTTLTISELSFLCNMSISSFKRHFTEAYGIAPQRYFFQQRMVEAERLLICGMRASEIFDRIGYESLAAFSSAFRKYFGCSPKQYVHQFGLPEKVFEPAAKQPAPYL